MHTLTDTATRDNTLALYTGRTPRYYRVREAVRTLVGSAALAAPIVALAFFFVDNYPFYR